MSKSIAQIKEEFAQAGPQGLPALYAAYGGDPRTGVQNLIKQYRRKKKRSCMNASGLEQMKTYERQHADCTLICGIDEAGRGPLAGPVVAGAVILPKDCEILYLNDSKKLSAGEAGPPL